MLRAGHAGSAAIVQMLHDSLQQHAAPYKYPRAVVFVDKLPRTQTGKLQRFKLRDTPLCPEAAQTARMAHTL